MAGIRLFFDERPFTFIKRRELKGWLKDVITEEGKTTGDINYIFVNDQELLKMNQEYLNHDDFTDILTFPLGEAGRVLTGDIYISLDRVKENAEGYHVNVSDELKRVMVHGILHLCGYKDKTRTQKKLMRQKEDYYLQKSTERSAKR